MYTISINSIEIRLILLNIVYVCFLLGRAYRITWKGTRLFMSKHAHTDTQFGIIGALYLSCVMLYSY